MAKEPVSHTNRRGKTYYLHEATTRKGQRRLVMKASPTNAMTELPDGYEITEGVNGEVSVRRVAPRAITELELRLVQAELAKRDLMGYRAAVKGPYITVYEPVKRPEDIEELLGFQATFARSFVDQIASQLPDDSPDAARVRELLGKAEKEPHETVVRRTVESSRVEPVLRFHLLDARKRLFDVERMTYRGEGGWHCLHDPLPLREAAEKYLPHLGEESFFELV